MITEFAIIPELTLGSLTRAAFNAGRTQIF